MITRSGSQIAQEVLRELKWGTPVDGSEIVVTVDQQVVVLTGAVSSYLEKRAAQEAAHRVAGVLDVVNDIQVRGPDSLARADVEIAKAVRRALERDSLLPAHRIRSTVSDGWVTLAGQVESARDSEMAAETVQRIPGVHGVHNHITVGMPAAEPELAGVGSEDRIRK
jgi:osmotically-inducible protein OsmY